MQGIHKYDNNDPEFLAIAAEITANPTGYLGYLKLGAYYGTSNLYKSYLCYENAIFYCEDQSVKDEALSILNELKNAGFGVPKAAIVILSWNLRQMTLDCIESIKKTTPDSAREIIVVDNASSDDSVEYLRKVDGITLIENDYNAGFPGGCNIGIRAAQPDSDIYLLNNDTLLTANALFWLRMGLYEDESFGAVGSTANHVANFQSRHRDLEDVSELLKAGLLDNVPLASPYTSRVYLVGFSLLIKRSVLEQVGYLDEQFHPGNFEDTDICYRILEAGYQNVLCENSFIIHFGSQSFGKKKDGFSTTLAKNEAIFNAKWDLDDYQKYTFPNLNVINFFSSNLKDGINGNFLLLHCGGATQLALEKYFPDSTFYSFEKDKIWDTLNQGLNSQIVTSLEEFKNLLRDSNGNTSILACSIEKAEFDLLNSYNYCEKNQFTTTDGITYFLFMK